MRWIYSIVFVWMLGIMGGCTSTRTYSDKAQGVDYNTYKTYAWLKPHPGDTTGNKLVNNDITYGNLRAAVDKEMRRRGFTIDTENPDVLLKIRTEFHNRVDVARNPLYSSYNYYWYPASPSTLWDPYYYQGYYNPPYISAYDLRPELYSTGTVAIDMIDRNQRRVVWRGWTNEEVMTQADTKRMYKDISKIFYKFPVKASKK